MSKRTVTFTLSQLAYFKKLQTNAEKVEYNGEVKFDHTGNITQITAQQGQTVDVCVQGCHINYHTHPEDYIRYYPNHPSLTDMEYILFAVARTRELSVHMVFTPLYVYIITLAAATRSQLQAGTLSEDVVTQRLRALFSKLQKHDRSSDMFRQAWMAGLREIGYLIERHEGYDTPFQIHLNAVDPRTIQIIAADSREFVVPTSRSPWHFLATVLLLCFLVWWWNHKSDF